MLEFSSSVNKVNKAVAKFRTIRTMWVSLPLKYPCSLLSELA